MPQDATCPKCSHVFPVTEARHAYTVICPRCEGELTAEFKKPAAPPAAGQPPYELLVKPGALNDAATALPGKAKKRNEDDEEKQRNGGSAVVVLLSGGLGLMFVLGGLALTGWYLFTQIYTEEETVSRSNNNWNNNNSPWANNNNNNPKPNPTPNPNPWPSNNPNPKPNPWPPVNNPPPVWPPEPVKPKDTFDLKPVKGTLTQIVPPKDMEEGIVQRISLNGKADSVTIGGGGRYIILHFPEGRLVVFDANAGDITKDIANGERGNAQIAGGANTLVSAIPNTNKYRVYTLPDLKVQSEFELPLAHGANSITMGAATNGPLLARNVFGDVVLMDITFGKPIEGASGKPGLKHAHQIQTRVTHDGKMFTDSGGFGRGDVCMILTESQQKWSAKEWVLGSASPSADGTRLYGKDQILSSNGDVVAGKPFGVDQVWYVPAATANADNYFLRVNEKKAVAPRQKNVLSVSLHKGKDVDTPVMGAWEGASETERLLDPFGSVPLDRHLFLIPEAKLLVILNADKSQLAIRKLGI